MTDAERQQHIEEARKALRELMGERKAISGQSLAVILEKFALQIGSAIKEAGAPMLERIAELERELTEVKAKSFRYLGTWQPGNYEPGAACTWSGSMWVCREATDQKPGSGPAWQLAAKRGKDGKDAQQ